MDGSSPISGFMRSPRSRKPPVKVAKKKIAKPKKKAEAEARMAAEDAARLEHRELPKRERAPSAACIYNAMTERGRKTSQTSTSMERPKQEKKTTPPKRPAEETPKPAVEKKKKKKAQAPQPRDVEPSPSPEFMIEEEARFYYKQIQETVALSRAPAKAKAGTSRKNNKKNNKTPKKKAPKKKAPAKTKKMGAAEEAEVEAAREMEHIAEMQLKMNTKNERKLKASFGERSEFFDALADSQIKRCQKTISERISLTRERVPSAAAIRAAMFL